MGYSSGAETRSSSKGMGWGAASTEKKNADGQETYSPINLVLFKFAFLLNHQEGMVEQENDQLGTVSLRSSALLQRTLVNQFTAFFW